MSDQSPGSRSAQLDRALTALLSATPELEAAAVVSFDGLPMASALPATMDEDRVAAMSAALLSLGERAAEGLGRGELSQVYIEGETGTVFLVSADNEAVLVAVAAPRAKAGLMLYEVRRAAAVVAAVLRADEVADGRTAEPLVPEQSRPSSVAEPVAYTGGTVVAEPVVQAVPATEPVVPAVPAEEAALPAASVQPVPAPVSYVSPLDSSWTPSYPGLPSASGPTSPTWS